MSQTPNEQLDPGRPRGTSSGVGTVYVMVVGGG